MTGNGNGTTGRHHATASRGNVRADASGRLAYTGADPAPVASFGAALLVLGALMLVLRHRFTARRRS